MSTRSTSRRSVTPAPTPRGSASGSTEGEAAVVESGTFAKGTTASPARAPSDPTVRLARRLRARLVRPSDAAHARGSLGALGIPDDVLVLPDGSAIASYEGEPLLRYRSLGQLCAEHGLSTDELEER